MRRIVIFLLFILSFFVYTDVFADDYPDDIYDGDYSIEEMLKNYNLVTFGKKDINTEFKNTYPFHSILKGEAYLGHITGRFLINGNLETARIDLRPGEDDLLSFCNLKNGYLYFCGGEDANDCFKNSLIYLQGNTQWSIDLNYPNSFDYHFMRYPSANVSLGNYMNYDRLYESIIQEQKRIKKGTRLEANDYTLEIDTGGYYYIEDISNVHEIIFSNFEKNKDEITVITINNSGTVTFPKLFSDNYSVVATNDYLGMNMPARNYARYYVLESYYGNIIWNFPNADAITFYNDTTPLFGHVIAPKADVVTNKVFHAAGSYLVNSLYFPFSSSEGLSELHFYPLTKEIAHRNVVFKATKKVNTNHGDVVFPDDVDSENLDEGDTVNFTVSIIDGYMMTNLVITDEEGNEVEYTKVGDNEYEFVMPATNVLIAPTFKEKNIVNIITNPYTGNKIIIVLLSLVLLGFFVYYLKDKELRRKI